MKKLILLLSMVLAGCSTMPPVLKNVSAVDIQLNEVRNNVAGFEGKPVRWGGTIIKVENEDSASRMQILYYPLDSSARPKLDETSQGRFLIQTQKFLDPAIYKKNSKITVTGLLNGTASRRIGKKMLQMPVIDVENDYLWPEEKNPYYQPFCSGYYPSLYYGYYGFGSRFYYPCY